MFSLPGALLLALTLFLSLSGHPLVLSLPIFLVSCHIHTMGPCFLLFNDVFLISTSLLGVIPGYPGVISFSEFFFSIFCFSFSLLSFLHGAGVAFDLYHYD